MPIAILISLVAVGGLAVGSIGCFLIFRYTASGLLRKAEEEAEVIKKNKIVEAKEKFIALKLEHDNMMRADEQPTPKRITTRSE